METKKEDEEPKKKKKKEKEVKMDLKPEFKYNGTMKYQGRTTHRILMQFLHKKKVIMKGKILIDSATYAFSEVQIANQNVDLFKEFVPWYARGILG